jgi:hypothetical protein
MKRIIHVDEEVVSLYNITDASIVGVQWEDGNKGMITNTSEGFCSISNRYKPDTLNVWYSGTVQGYIERSLKQGNNTNSKAFVFETVSELYEWMSK